MSTNLFKRLKAILPDSPLLTGTVMLDFGDGTIQVALAGSSGQVRVRNPNQLALNSTVYVKDGVATEAAPDLPYVYIEV